MHSEFCNPADHYPLRIEHIMAPSQDQLAGRTELLDELVRALPLSEAAEILGPNYRRYLWRMCAVYAMPRDCGKEPKNYARALPYAEAMIAADPTADEGREARAFCLAQLAPVDYTALLADYDWLACRPLRGPAYWTYEVRNVDNTPEDNAWLVDRYSQEDLYRRTHYCLASAWAYYNLGDLSRAAEAFARGFAEPARDSFGFDPDWPVDLLPPVADDDYLLWQVHRHLQNMTYDSIPEAVRDWLGLAIRAMSPAHYARLKPDD